jgi:hypothetical protein
MARGTSSFVHRGGTVDERPDVHRVVRSALVIGRVLTTRGHRPPGF